MKTLSIIIPVYNNEKTIEKCILSIVNQTYPIKEIIVINDGSTDNSKEICQKLSTQYNNIILHTKSNGGVSSARNKGLELSSGELIQFVDSDDYIEPNMCEDMISKLERNNADCVICGFTQENSDGNILRRFNGISAVINSAEAWNKYFNLLYSSYFLFNIWNKMYHANIVKKENIKFNTDFSLGEDLIFNLNYLSKATNICITDKIYYHYVYNNNDSLTRKFRTDKHISDKTVFDQSLLFTTYKKISDNQSVFDMYLKNCFSTIETLFNKNCFSSREAGLEYIHQIKTASQTLIAIDQKKFNSKLSYLYKFILKHFNPNLIKFLSKIRYMAKKILMKTRGA